jgi:hypothetical protein
MTSFLSWLEANKPEHNIRVRSYDRTGLIVFDVDGKTYPYIMDAGYFYNGFFKNWMKYAPGKAFNFARKHGERADLPPKLPPSENQGTLF